MNKKFSGLILFSQSKAIYFAPLSVVVKWCRFARVKLPNSMHLSYTVKTKNYNVATIAEETNRLNFLMSSHLYVKWILYHLFCVFFCLKPLSFTRRALFNEHPNEWLTYEITWNYNSVSKYLQPYVMISIGSHFFVLSELLRPRNNSTVFELPNIQVTDNKAEL